MTSSTTGPSMKKRLMRIHSELATLKTSLPLEWDSSIFCVVDEDHMDVLQFLIIGPQDTPYENGCFIFDCILPNDYPNVPPHIVIQTTGGGKVRFNPNLYKDGKVCLSLLNTWTGPSWDPKTSTLLQVLVSIQSLIMVPKPFFNEPGMENQPGMEAQSNQYNATLHFYTVRLAMSAMISSPPFAFKQIIKTHFVLKQNEIKKQLQRWLTGYTDCTRGAYAHQMPPVASFNDECLNMHLLLSELTREMKNVYRAPSTAAAAAAVSLLDDDEEEVALVVEVDEDKEVICLE